MNTIGLYDYRKTKTPAKFTKHTFKIIKYNIRKSRNKLFENIPRIKNHKCHRYFKAVVAAINKNKITKVNILEEGFHSECRFETTGTIKEKNQIKIQSTRCKLNGMSIHRGHPDTRMRSEHA